MPAKNTKRSKFNKPRTPKNKISKKNKFPVWIFVSFIVLFVAVGVFVILSSSASPGGGYIYYRKTLHCSQGVCKLAPHTHNGRESISTPLFVRTTRSNTSDAECRTGLKFRDPKFVDTSSSRTGTLVDGSTREYFRRKVSGQVKERSNDVCVTPQNTSDL